MPLVSKSLCPKGFALTFIAVPFLSSCQLFSAPTPPSSTVAPPSPTAPTPLLPAISSPLAAPLAPSLAPGIDQFLAGTTNAGASLTGQGIWVQDARTLLVNQQGTVPLSAASLTKVATSYAALQTLGPAYRYTTKVGITGTLQNGVLKGDLIIQGGQNPFFVWEDAIALGNLLTQRGIRQVQGNLVLNGSFYMNFETDPALVGNLLRQGLDAAQWPGEALQQYQTLPPDTPKPQVAVQGTVGSSATLPEGIQWIAQQQSLPLASLLKKMNRYSNNPMADMIANSVGGAAAVAQKAIAVTGVDPTEVQLVNGSGLSVENRLSPRAACGLFLAIDRLMQAQGMTVGDILTVVGRDRGILDERALPTPSILKSGTLDTVSALAGVLPTQKAGVVWFAILNNDGDVDTFRRQQEQLLKTLGQNLGIAATLPPQLQPTLPDPTAATTAQLWQPLP